MRFKNTVQRFACHIATVAVVVYTDNLADHSAVTAISKVIAKYEQLGKRVTLTGLNEESNKLVNRVGLSSTSGH